MPLQAHLLNSGWNVFWSIFKISSKIQWRYFGKVLIFGDERSIIEVY